MNSESVVVHIDEGLATITLRRPQASNALDLPLKRGLLAAVEQVRQDARVRAVLLEAEGKNFCVGQDLAEHAAGLSEPATAMDTVGEHYNPLITGLAALEVPVVVAITGACVGAGLGIALAGDIRVAGENTKFATAFTGIGLAADSGLSHTLVHALGSSRATGLMLLGDRFTAADALAWGLVHRVVPDADVAATAAGLARRLAAGPTAAYKRVKQLVHATADGLGDALDREFRVQAELGQTADHQRAVSAFLAKQQPEFRGN